MQLMDYTNLQGITRTNRFDRVNFSRPDLEMAIATASSALLAGEIPRKDDITTIKYQLLDICEDNGKLPSNVKDTLAQQAEAAAFTFEGSKWAECFEDLIPGGLRTVYSKPEAYAFWHSQSSAPKSEVFFDYFVASIKGKYGEKPITVFSDHPKLVQQINRHSFVSTPVGDLIGSAVKKLQRSDLELASSLIIGLVDYDNCEAAGIPAILDGSSFSAKDILQSESYSFAEKREPEAAFYLSDSLDVSMH